MSNLWSPRLQGQAQRADFWPSDATPLGPPSMSIDADAFARGLDEGRRTVEAELAADREALLQLAQSLTVLDTPSAGLLASLMMASVERLVRDISGAAPVDADLLRQRAEALAAHIAGETVPVLVLHPDDAALIDANHIGVPFETDASLPRGTVQARSGEAHFEDGVQTAMARLRVQLDAMGLSA